MIHGDHICIKLVIQYHSYFQDFKRDYEQPAAVRPYMSNVPMNNLVSSWWYKQQHEKRDGVGGNGGILQFGRGRSTTVPLSILDNIDTLRRGLMRELTLRRMAQDRMSMVSIRTQAIGHMHKKSGHFAHSDMYLCVHTSSPAVLMPFPHFRCDQAKTSKSRKANDEQ